jgi:hypothetical protein
MKQAANTAIFYLLNAGFSLGLFFEPENESDVFI